MNKLNLNLNLNLLFTILFSCSFLVLNVFTVPNASGVTQIAVFDGTDGQNNDRHTGIGSTGLANMSLGFKFKNVSEPVWVINATDPYGIIHEFDIKLCEAHCSDGFNIDESAQYVYIDKTYYWGNGATCNADYGVDPNRPNDCGKGRIYVSASLLTMSGTVFWEETTGSAGATWTFTSCINMALLGKEPSEAPTGVLATTVDSTTINLAWIGSAGNELPNGYLITVRSLISGSKHANISDGTPVPDDSDISDGNLAVNVPHVAGANSYNITGLNPGTMYEAQIVPYANANSQYIDYKTDNIQSDISTTNP